MLDVAVRELTPRPLRERDSDALLFVDVNGLVAKMERSLEGGLHVLLLGRRGSGKTSALHQLAHRLRQQGRDVVFISGNQVDSARSLLETVRTQLGLPIRRTLNEERETLLELLSSLAGADHEIIVIVDDLPPAGVAPLVFGRLRDELWELPFLWVASGDVADKASYLRPPADAFFSHVFTLPDLTPDIAARIVQARTGLADDDPWLLRFGDAVHGGTPRDAITFARESLMGDGDLFDTVAQRRLREEKMQDLGEAARRLMEALAVTGPISASDEAVARGLGWTRSRTTQVLKQLEAAGLVNGSLDRTGHARPRKVYELID
jgi:AAA ATPase domain